MVYWGLAIFDIVIVIFLIKYVINWEREREKWQNLKLNLKRHPLKKLKTKTKTKCNKFIKLNKLIKGYQTNF